MKSNKKIALENVKGCGNTVFKYGINEFGQKDNMTCGTFWIRRFHCCENCITKIKQHAEDCERFLEFLESITYGCDRWIDNTATCGDINFKNKIMLCKKCSPMFDKIQEEIQDLKETIKIYKEKGLI